MKYLFLLILLNSCSKVNNFSLWESINLPYIEGAKVLVEETNEYSRQIVSLLIADYPDETAYHLYDDYFKQNKWTECVNVVDNDWYSFVDLTGIHEVRIFQKIKHYVNLKSKLIGIIHMKYTSVDINNEIYPDNNNQYINLIIILSKNLDQEIEKLNIKC